MQAQLELVAQQRAQALTISYSFNERQRNAHAVRRKIDGKLAGIGSAGLRRHQIRRAAPPRRPHVEWMERE